MKICELKQTNNNEEILVDSVIINQHTVDTDKLAVIHVVSSTKSVAMAPFRKLTILKNIKTGDGIINKDKNVLPSTPAKAEVYHQRKRMLPEYKELFAALMKLPDKEMQKKLLDVINSHHSIERRTVETQTDPTDFKDSAINTHDVKTCNNMLSAHSNVIENLNVTQDNVKKRKRKRKVSLPQANKESRTKQLAKMNKPKAAYRQNVLTPPYKTEPENSNSPKRQRIDSFCFSECGSDLSNIVEDTQTNHLEEIKQTFSALENGLLPIQDAVVRNQTNKLNIHISLWEKYNSIDFNDILTDEDEDLLQLAVLNTCDPSVFSLLLNKGLSPNTLDADSNTIVHLAILNDITVLSLDYLLNYIDLKLILTLNDDGYTPLHLAIRQDRYLLAECLINVLDQRLLKKTFYKRPVDALETNETLLKKHFKDYYENKCLKMASDEEADSCIIENPDLKQKLLQAGDRRSGNTALYFAIDNRFEHLIYFLLAHLTDPRTENLSGVDCKTYFCEFGKSLHLSLNIDNTMDKVIKLLS